MKQDAWINAIIGRLCESSTQMVILFDYDGLTLNTAIFERLVGTGYDVYDYTDNLSLFFYLESKRQMVSGNDDSKLMIRISADLVDNAQLPYSVMVKAEKVELRLEDFFTGLNAKAIKELPSQYYSSLFELLGSHPQYIASYNESIDFITRRVFGIDIAGISSEVQFWAILFKLHYTDTELPGFLVDKLHDAGDRFVSDYEIDLRHALESSEHFFSFLQNEWSHFLDDRINQAVNIKVLPFDHHDLKVYTDNFFAEGMLQRVRIDATRDDGLGWISCGIELKTLDPVDQIESLMSLVQSHLPGLESSFRDWQKFTKDYAELLFKLYSVNDPHDSENIHKLRTVINDRFQKWIQQHYDSLSSLPSTKPAMVHQVAKSMAYR
ncbi:MAG: BREX-3 system phosphatase PglZ, partial [Erysipelotrichia bacterium]|nr:BREX-3 system phosphatase PglZ [Erysipelotrichia bacterium]